MMGAQKIIRKERKKEASNAGEQANNKILPPLAHFSTATATGTTVMILASWCCFNAPSLPTHCVTSTDE